ncbi:hypothetical protein [Sphingomonas faeni]|uniref:hypothetical protein n=1 Tax=Sphingomonas faeni TaxID=185950 RepID=UPI0020C0BAAB|nr:hypothetical protein [Sphingomonas faeni]MCK8457044.1 hypothetical protein [Sphingomonas faeni]
MDGRKSKRTINRQFKAARALAELGAGPGDLVPTSLSSAAEQSALLKLPSREAATLILAAKRGKQVSAKRRLRAITTPEAVTHREVAALIQLFNRSGIAARTKFQELLLASVTQRTTSSP